MDNITPKTQIIVVSQERCKIFKETIDKEEFFTPTELDNHISDFIDSVTADGGCVVGVATMAGQENIIAVVSWYDAETVKKISALQNSKIAVPSNNPLRLA